jgi:hypothetical protein
MPTTRRALIISNPGEVGDEHYCKGVFRDVENYIALLSAAHGGWWSASEIVHMEKPDANEVRAQIAVLGQYDYSFVAFAGHGYFSSIDRATVLKLRKNVELSSIELLKGATKRTLALDCCREVKNKSAFMALSAKSAHFEASRSVSRNPNPALCKGMFLQQIDSASKAVVVLHSCTPGEVAGDDEVSGGYYTSNLIGSANVWAGRYGNQNAYGSSAFSIVAAHDVATPMTVRDSRDKNPNEIQNPTIEKPRTESNFFPFAVFA